MKSKVGRPMKYGEETMARLEATTTQANKTRIKLSGRPVSYFLEFGINALLGDPEEKKLNDMKDRLAKIEPEYLLLKAQIIQIEDRKKQLEELRRKKAVQDKYMHSAFSEVIRNQEKHGKIVVNMSWIEEAYGISFDDSLVNRNYSQALEDLNLLPEYVVEKYHIEKVRKGQREDRMMVSIVDKEGDE